MGVTGLKMRHRIREELGRKATDTDLASLDTWMEVERSEKGKNKPLG
jgi:hypothetical protein